VERLVAAGGAGETEREGGRRHEKVKNNTERQFYSLWGRIVRSFAVSVTTQLLEGLIVDDSEPQICL